MWSEASLEQPTRLQAVFFLRGLAFDDERFGTAPTCLAFSELQQIRGDENDVTSPGGSDRRYLLVFEDDLLAA